MLIALPALALVLCPSLWLLLGRPRRVPSAPVPDAPTANISVIIPARDEAHTIGRLLDTINAQSVRPHETIVVDDASSDATAVIAAARGATVLTGQELPHDWRGKPWACFQGAQAASAGWLLFLDADTELENGAMAKFSTLSATHGNSVHSVCPYHLVRHAHEQFSAFFNLCMVAGAGAFGAASRPALFGQSLLVSKANYDRIGGHTPVKNRILENLYLTGAFAQQGIKCTSYLGHGTLSMRMYPESMTDLWRGWSKGFLSGASATSGLPLALCSAWITGAMCVLVSAFLALCIPTSVPFLTLTALAYALYVAQCLWSLRQIGSFTPWTSILFPVPLLFYQTLILFSLIRGKKSGTLWKGRHVR